MKLDLMTKKQDEYYTPPYAIRPILKYLPMGAKVWCPFDTEDSMFVKMIRNHGCDVVATHIVDGHDFFETNRECEYIISNPPYSLKGEVFNRLFALGRPFAMLVGVVGIFESQARFEMFRDNEFEVLYMNRRVSYFKDYEDQKPALNPPFSSVYIASKMLPSRLVFEEINKKDVSL